MSNKKLKVVLFEAGSNNYEGIESVNVDSAPIVEFRNSVGVVVDRIGFFKLIYPKSAAYKISFVKDDSGFVVVDDSIFLKERIDFVIKVIKAAVEGRLNLDNLKKSLCAILGDDSSFNIRFSSMESCVSFYRYYTDLLFSRMRLSKIKGNAIKRGTASSYQTSLVILFSVVFGLSREEVFGWYFYISDSKRNKGLSSIGRSAHDFKISYALNRRVFEGIFDFIFSDSIKPLFIKFDDIFEKDLLYISSVHQSWKDEVSNSWIVDFTYDKDRFYSYFEAVNKVKEKGLVLSKSDYVRIFRRCNRNINSSEYMKKKLANHAVFAFVSTLAAETGANSASILSIDLNSGGIEKELGQYRVIAVKDRSNYQKQNIRIPASFLPVWRKYLKLRDWMINNSNSKEHALPFAIHYSLHKGVVNDIKPVKPICLSTKSYYLMPNDFPFIPLSEWRKRKSQSLTNKSDGDLSISAAVLNQSTATAKKNYTSSRFETAAVEFHSFFNDLNKYSKLIVSEGANVPPVIDDGFSIKSGHCRGHESNDANKIEYLDDRVPDPDCKKSIHCVFCSKFGIHNSVKDIKKLLSMKVWAVYQSKSAFDGIEVSLVKYSGIIQRIDAILDGFLKHYPESICVYDKALNDVSNGDFDNFWGAKIRAYIEAGI